MSNQRTNLEIKLNSTQNTIKITTERIKNLEEIQAKRKSNMELSSDDEFFLTEKEILSLRLFLDSLFSKLDNIQQEMLELSDRLDEIEKETINKK